MTSQDLLAHVAGHAGVAIDDARIATRAVLSAIACYLPEPRRQFIADELPGDLRDAVLSATSRALPLEERLFAPGGTLAHARELVASVCRALAEELSNEALATLRAALPADLRGLLEPPGPEGVPEHFVAGLGETLARGKLGSQHPIGDTPAPHAHASSVSAENPHGATKLSSSPGTTQEREHHTLSETRGAANRSLATAKS